MVGAFRDLMDRIGRFEQSMHFVDNWCAAASAIEPGEFPGFDPLDAPPLLPFLYLLEREGERLRYRVSGGNVNQLFGSEHTSRYFDEVVPDLPYRVVAPYYFQVLDGRCCIFKGHVILPRREFIEFERVLVPISRQGRDLILGCASFSTTATLRSCAPDKPPPGFHFYQLSPAGTAVEENWADIEPLISRIQVG